MATNTESRRNIMGVRTESASSVPVWRAADTSPEESLEGILDRAYTESVTVPLPQAAAELQEVLSRPLAAYVAGVKDGKTVARWAGGDAAGIRTESERRVRAAYGIMRILRTRYESPETLRAWFIGMNPELDDDSPADALHAGHLRDAVAAARSFAYA
jgi:hypothetical protein